MFVKLAVVENITVLAEQYIFSLKLYILMSKNLKHENKNNLATNITPNKTRLPKFLTESCVSYKISTTILTDSV